MEECLRWCKEHDVTPVERNVVITNKSAFRIYKKHGFEVVGTLPKALHYADGNYADEYYVIKDLD